MKTRFVLAAFSIALCAAACGDDDGGHSHDAATIDGATIDGATLDGPVTIDASTIDGTIGETCGGFGDIDCPPDMYCDYPDDMCSAADTPGTCVPRPDSCPIPRGGIVGPPICGCDGQIYETECQAATSGSDVSILPAHCTPPEGTFRCGYTFCEIDQQYCVGMASGISGGQASYSCPVLPAECEPSPDCDCLDGESCVGGTCEADDDGNLLVTCVGA
jgi:hypothetical protein